MEFDLTIGQIRPNLTLFRLTFIELYKCMDFEYAIFDQVEFVFIK